MNITYLSSACSQVRFDRLVAEGKITKLPQAQKDHHLLLEGLRQVSSDMIIVISSYPVANSPQKVYETEKENEDGVEYLYPGFINLPFVRQFGLWLNTIRLILKSCKGKDNVIVCDVLNRSIFYSAKCVRFFKRIKIIGIVTDVPGLTSGARAKLLPWWKRTMRTAAVKLSKNSVKTCDAYLLLTEAMNDVVNPKHKPYIVIEGHSDITMKKKINNLENKTVRKTIMYAGGTHKEFGIEMLVHAFLGLNNPEWDLHIYGDGNYQKELLDISSKHNNVVYHGMQPNSQIVEAQIKSWLLVNPRITNAEYVKYSFPSKTLECMASGTPLLTTRLAGMPKDYYPYVYLFEEETIDGFKHVLKGIFEIPADELHKKGTNAKEFALEQKNNVKQAAQFYSFIKNVIYDNR